MSWLSFNLPLMSIPAYYILASLPHAYAGSVATKGDFSKYDNRNPHSANNLDKIKRSLPAADYAKYERCKRAHQNALENMPLYVAAVFAGLLVERTTGSGLFAAKTVGLESFVWGFMACRAVYTVNYVVTESQEWSMLRSLMYGISTFWAFGVIGKAAYVLGA